MEENQYSPETDSIDQETTYFPPKPEEEQSQQSATRSIFSMVVFIIAFYLVFDWDLATIFILVGVLLVHELGHFLAMQLFGYTNLGILFLPLLGAVATGYKDTISQKQSVIVSFAGPVPGVIAGTILYVLGQQNGNELLLTTANIFILLNLFNLLPVMPLDGGRILKTTFFERNRLIGNIFIIISILLISYYCFTTESYFFLVIPLFLVLQLFGQSRNKKIQEALQDKNLNIDQSFTELSDRDYWLIREEIGNHVAAYSTYITPGHYQISERESGIIKQVKSVLYKKPIMDLGFLGKLLVILTWLAAFIIPVVVILL
jgi:stage IV sporulation protein FB